MTPTHEQLAEAVERVRRDIAECNRTSTKWIYTPVRTTDLKTLLSALEAKDAALRLAIPASVCLTNRNVPDSTIIPLDMTMGDLRKIATALGDPKP